jgi:SWI/SNF-related matrix-associated actin-dependent regulator 1 of chromatin subfamily A
MCTIEEKLGVFKPRNRVVLTSLVWQKNLTSTPTSIWTAPVPEGHPAWEVLRLNKALMHERGFRAVRGETGEWRLEVTLENGNEEQLVSGLTQSNLVVPAPEGLAYYPFQRAGIDFLATRSTALLADEMGCIGGDEIIGYFRRGITQRLSLREFVRRFNRPGHWPGKTYVKSLLPEGILKLNQVIAALPRGKKQTVRITFESGRTLVCTPDHELAVVGGFREAKQLQVGAEVLVSGIAVCRECGETDQVAPRARSSDGRVYGHIVVAEKMLGRTLAPAEQVDHKNGIKSDNRPENIEVLLARDLPRAHRSFLHLNGGRSAKGGEIWFLPEIDKIKAVEANGIIDVYDLVMAGPAHNFVVSGVIVHNCGKTIQLAGLLNLRGQELQRVLVVTPASVKRIWALELSKWLVRKVPIMIVKGPTRPLDLPTSGIWIINYELLTKFRSALLREPWDLIALDEAHFIKNRSSRRTKACFGLAKVARRKILLTGTPLLNRPAELWALLHFLAPAEWLNFYRFAHRYCAPFRSEWRWDFSGASNLEELNAKLRRGLMLRRLKKDVLFQLPPLTRALVPLDVGLGDLEALTRLAGLDPLKMPLELDPLSIPLDCVAKIRHELGRLKAGSALTFILEQAESSDDKFVVFAHHRAVLDELYRGLAGSGAVLVTGETPEADRQSAIERFQTDPSTRFFVASIRAMGIGVTLSAASRVIFVEQDWTPSILRQAEDRLHRISQTQAVLVQYLVVPDSIDINVMRSVIAKIEVIERTIEAA